MADGSARITVDWADGEHSFRLGMKQLRELQDKTGVGPEALYRRLALGEWRVEDVRETIRLGLIGGGMDEVEASRTIRHHIDDGAAGLLKHKPTATAVILAALMGPPDDKIAPGKKSTRGRQARKSPSQATSESLALSE